MSDQWPRRITISWQSEHGDVGDIVFRRRCDVGTCGLYAAHDLPHYDPAARTAWWGEEAPRQAEAGCR